MARSKQRIAVSAAGVVLFLGAACTTRESTPPTGFPALLPDAAAEASRVEDAALQVDAADDAADDAARGDAEGGAADATPPDGSNDATAEAGFDATDGAVDGAASSGGVRCGLTATGVGQQMASDTTCQGALLCCVQFTGASKIGQCLATCPAKPSDTTIANVACDDPGDCPMGFECRSSVINLDGSFQTSCVDANTPLGILDSRVCVVGGAPCPNNNACTYYPSRPTGGLFGICAK